MARTTAEAGPVAADPRSGVGPAGALLGSSPGHRPAVLIDCDPGHDDALALLLAGQTTELLGVTAVAGNAPLAKTLHNALITTQIAKLNVPVVAGADRPLVVEPQHAAYIHGESGLDGPTLPRLERSATPGTAAAFILDLAARRDDLWIVALGPLTNIALALRESPGLAQRIRGISLMGGSAGPGNVTASAEFNIWADPEAAAIVFGSGARLIMAGLDVTHQFTIDADRRQRLRDLGTNPARFAADLLTYYSEAYRRSAGGAAAGPLHDPCAVLALTHPELFDSEDLHVRVEVRGEHTRGMTVVDRRGGKLAAVPNTKVLTRIDHVAAFDILVKALAAYG